MQKTRRMHRAGLDHLSSRATVLLSAIHTPRRLARYMQGKKRMYRANLYLIIRRGLRPTSFKDSPPPYFNNTFREVVPCVGTGGGQSYGAVTTTTAAHTSHNKVFQAGAHPSNSKSWPVLLYLFLFNIPVGTNLPHQF